MAEKVREHEIYYARIAEQAERYDEMAEHMKTAALLDADLDLEERNLLAVAYKQAVGQRRTSWRIVCAAERAEEEAGNRYNQGLAKAYRKQIEAEMTKLCENILALLKDTLIPRCKSADAEVSYRKAEGDYHRYICEISDDIAKTREANDAEHAYKAGTKAAEDSLLVTNQFSYEKAWGCCQDSAEGF
jgi:14-3-3 protein epsilon